MQIEDYGAGSASVGNIKWILAYFSACAMSEEALLAKITAQVFARLYIEVLGRVV